MTVYVLFQEWQGENDRIEQKIVDIFDNEAVAVALCDRKNKQPSFFTYSVVPWPVKKGA